LSATGTISHLLSANSGVTGFSSQNSNAGTSAYLLSSLNNGTNLLNSYILGVNWSGTFLAGGPATQSAGIYTSANIPISIGINNAEVARFTSTGLAVTGELSAINSAGQGFLTLGSGAGTSYSFINMRGNATQRAWQVSSNNFLADALQITPSTTAGGNTYTTPVLTVATTGVAVTGALSCTGALAIGNTVNTVSPTSPNRTVTIVIGGTTYYLAAKTTND
jgi:hypothetical protein